MDNIAITWKEQQPAELLTQVGEWLETHKQYNFALAYYEAALSANPEYGLSAWRSGQLKLKQGNYADAAGNFEHMLKISPDHAPTHYLTSLAYSGMGQPERALAYAESALLYNPKHDGAHLQKLRCLGILENWSELNDACQSSPSSLNHAGEVHLWCALAALHVGDFQRGHFHYEQLSSKLKRQFSEVVKQIENLFVH